MTEPFGQKQITVTAETLQERLKEKVVVTYLHPGEVGGPFCASLVELVQWDAVGPKRLIDGGRLLNVQTGPALVFARNKQVREFLAVCEETPSVEWLWIIDSDMSFPANTLEQLLVVADPTERPCVGGLCFGLFPPDFSIGHPGGIAPTLYQFHEDGGTYRFSSWPENSLFEVDGTGAACLLVHKDLLRKMAEMNPEPTPWFAEVPRGNPRNPQDFVSEDLTFCMRVKAAGYPVLVHTGIEIGHQKSIVLDSRNYISPDTVKAYVQEHGVMPPGVMSPVPMDVDTYVEAVRDLPTSVPTSVPAHSAPVAMATGQEPSLPPGKAPVVVLPSE